MPSRLLVLFVALLLLVAGCTPTGKPAPTPPPVAVPEPAKTPSAPLDRFRERNPKATIVGSFVADLNQDGKAEVAVGYTLAGSTHQRAALLDAAGELLWAPPYESLGAPIFQMLRQGDVNHLVVIQPGMPNLVYIVAMTGPGASLFWQGEADEAIQVVGNRVELQKRIYKAEGGYTVKAHYVEWVPAEQRYDWGAPPTEPAPREATVRWPKPPQGVDYLPLPNGMLVTTTPRSSQPFQIAGWATDGRQVWARNWSAEQGAIVRVDLAGDGERVAVVTDKGLVHVLSTRTGIDVAAVQLVLEGEDQAQLIANGQYIAHTYRTASGAVPLVMRVYPVQSGAKPLYGTSGVAVHASPYHAAVIGLEGSELTIETPTGKVGPVAYDAPVQLGMAEITSRADGRLFFVRKLQNGTDLFDQSLTPQGWMSVSQLSDFAPVAGLFWRNREGNKLVIYKPTETYQVRGSAGEAKVAFVLPGGEAVVKESAERYCVIQPEGAREGCYRSVQPSKVIVDGRSFYWTKEADGAIAGYVVK